MEGLIFGILRYFTQFINIKRVETYAHKSSDESLGLYGNFYR